MKRFTIIVKETLEMQVSVVAKSLEDAVAKAQMSWRRGDYVLGAEHFTGVEFTEAEKK